MRFLVTGGAGFIGSAVVRRLVSDDRHEVMTLDALTYAGNLESLDGALDNPRHHFERADICDRATVRTLLTLHEPDAILHLAAESHVDRSIDGAADFVQTNLVGTFILLDEALRYWHGLDPSRRSAFRFVHVSSDEVFGSIASDAPPFSEDSRYDPTSPYAATKAGSDHLARAWHRTHGLPVIVTNCSNNYGPYQFPEKLIPLMILNALEGQTLPVYGQGDNIRDWLYVEDHVDALLAVVERGRIGETYAIGGRSERRNIEIVRSICALIDEMRPDTSIGPRENLIRYVSDRPGHDHRYAIDPGKAERDLGWSPRVPLASGLRRTVTWYLENPGWTARVQSGEYRRPRLGLGASA